MSKCVNKSITDFFAKKVPWQELNTNNAKFYLDDDLLVHSVYIQNSLFCR